jgi:hypothetical protein
MNLSLLSSRGRQWEVGAGGGVLGDGSEIVGDKVGGGLGWFAVVEFVGAGGEGEDVLTSTELGGVGFSDEIAFGCFHLFSGENCSQSAAPTEGFLRKKFFMGQSVLDGFFVGIDLLKGLGDLPGILSIQTVVKAVEVLQAHRFTGDADQSPNEDSAAGRFVSKMDGIEVTCCGCVGLLLHFCKAAFGGEGDGEFFDGTKGAHGVLNICRRVIIRDAGLIGKAAAGQSECRAVLVNEVLEVRLAHGIAEGIGIEDLSPGIDEGIVAVGIGHGWFGGRGFDASQENDGGKQDVSEDQKREKEFDSFLRCHVCAD